MILCVLHPVGLKLETRRISADFFNLNKFSKLENVFVAYHLCISFLIAESLNESYNEHSLI